jgi:hypothetical protein
MIDLVDAPRLYFFRHTPKDLLAHPPLASSLQSFESCQFLIALQRYPHAFTACVFSIEGAIKAAYGQPSWGNDSLQKLLEKAQGESSRLGSFNKERLDSLRRTRNRIVHYGFNLKDDRHTATLLLSTGIPFLRACYESFFDVVLDDALLIEFGNQLRIAEEVFEKFKLRSDLNPVYCLNVLGHLLRWSVKDSLISHWEAEAARTADEDGAKSETILGQKEKVERLLDPSWAFDCPICGGLATFVCELVNDDLDKKQISLLRAVCVECGLAVPRGCPFLADALCREQVDEKRDQILYEFGIS